MEQPVVTAGRMVLSIEFVQQRLAFSRQAQADAVVGIVRAYLMEGAPICRPEADAWYNAFAWARRQIDELGRPNRVASLATTWLRLDSQIAVWEELQIRITEA